MSQRKKNSTDRLPLAIALLLTAAVLVSALG